MTSAIVRRATLLLLSLSLPLAACNGGKKDAGAGAGPAKKVFRFYRREAYKSLDPLKQFDVPSAELIMNVYDALLDYDYLQRPYTLVPNLLTRMPELSADQLTYLFELRDDVRFNDDPCFPGGKGRALTSDDVIYTLKRFADANVNTRSFGFLQGAVEGIDAFREQTQKLGKATDYAKLQLSGISKLDARHFAIKLTRPNPLALYPLAATQLSIVAREAVERYGREFENHPVGSGPFTIKTLARRGVTVLQKNPHYHATYPTRGAAGDAEKGLLAAAGKRLPLLDEVELQLIEEPQTSMLKFLSGQIDWVAMDRDAFIKLAYRDSTGFHLKPEYARKHVIYAEPGLDIEFLFFNMKDPVVGKNRALRQAIAHALDSAGYLAQMLNGRGEVVHSIVPPALAGNERDVPAEGYAHDVALAKQKLAEAGFPGGKGLPPLVMDERSATAYVRNQFEYVRANLEQAGITLKPNLLTFTAFFQRAEAGNFQIAKHGWVADYPDAENFYQLLYSKNKAPGANFGCYDNPEYDRLYEQIRFMPNGPERFALFAKMNAIIHRDLPVIVIYGSMRVGMHQPWVKNFKRNLMLEMPFKYLDVDPAHESKGRH